MHTAVLCVKLLTQAYISFHLITLINPYRTNVENRVSS